MAKIEVFRIRKDQKRVGVQDKKGPKRDMIDLQISVVRQAKGCEETALKAWGLAHSSDEE